MRSLLYVPSHSERFLAKAHERGADGVILDLEDSVPEADKDAARAQLKTSVAQVGQGGSTVFVRVNAEPERLQEDVLAACAAGAFGVMIPKFANLDVLHELDRVLSPVEARLGREKLTVIGLIETPGAVLNAAALAKGPRVIALATGGEDFALALGGKPTPEVLKLPKLLVHYAAKAEGLLSFGLLRSIADYSDHRAIGVAIAEAREHGFDGATCVHPGVVPLLNVGFAPSAEELAWAERVLAKSEGQKGAFALDGVMVDLPVLLRAKRISGRQ